MNLKSMKGLILILLGVFVISSAIALSLSRVVNIEGLDWRWKDLLTSEEPCFDGGNNNLSLFREFPAGDLREIRIQTLFESTEISSSSDDIVYLRYYGKTQKAHKAEDVFKVSQQKNGRLLEMKSDWPTLSQSCGNRNSLKLTLKVPSDLLGSITIRSVSGDVSLADLKLKDDLAIEAVSSQINMENLSVESASLKTISGDIDAINLQTTENLKIETTSGEATGSALTTKTIQVNTISGDMNLKLFSEEFSAKSVSGDFDIEFAGSELEVKTLSGDINLTMAEGKEFNLEANTKSGHIRNAFSSSAKSESKSVSTLAANTDADVSEVKINTLAGDIYIDKASDS